jgi:glycosyltransferase involved in cell wall biosynthesis
MMRGTGLKVGIDARLMGADLTGIGHYVTELCKELSDLLPGAQFLMYAPWNIRMPVDSVRWHVRVDPWQRLFERLRGWWGTKHAWLLLRTGILCARDGINVFWATQAPLIPWLRRDIRLVATVHDLGQWTAAQTQRRLMVHGHRFLQHRLARVDAILVNSEETARKLFQFTGYRASGIVRPAVSSCFRPADTARVQDMLRRLDIRQPYLLTVGSDKPHKNLDLLIRVFASMKQEGLLAPYSLVLCGPGTDALPARVREPSGAPRDVRGLGYVTDDDLPLLYSGAEAFVFPSLNEGFGMPVLEARACRTKIVATDAPELREAGGERAIYIRPDAAGIRRGILAVTGAPRFSDPDTLWSWRSSAQILADAMEPPDAGAR